MPVRNLPGAPVRVGELVRVHEENIRPWTGRVMAAKPTRENGWWISVWRDDCEIVVHESLVEVWS